MMRSQDNKMIQRQEEKSSSSMIHFVVQDKACQCSQFLLSFFALLIWYAAAIRVFLRCKSNHITFLPKTFQQFPGIVEIKSNPFPMTFITICEGNSPYLSELTSFYFSLSNCSWIVLSFLHPTKAHRCCLYRIPSPQSHCSWLVFIIQMSTQMLPPQRYRI